MKEDRESLRERETDVDVVCLDFYSIRPGLKSQQLSLVFSSLLNLSLYHCYNNIVTGVSAGVYRKHDNLIKGSLVRVL